MRRSLDVNSATHACTSRRAGRVLAPWEAMAPAMVIGCVSGIVVAASMSWRKSYADAFACLGALLTLALVLAVLRPEAFARLSSLQVAVENVNAPCMQANSQA